MKDNKSQQKCYRFEFQIVPQMIPLKTLLKLIYYHFTDIYLIMKETLNVLRVFQQ